MIGRTVHAAAAPIWRINNDEKRNLFFTIIFLIIPFSTIFSVCILGSFNEMINPIMKKQLLTTKINFSSFANPAATIPASHPRA